MEHTEQINGTKTEVIEHGVKHTKRPSGSSCECRKFSHLEEVDLIGKLADLKEAHYRQTLLLSAIIQLLEERQLITRDEVTAKAATLDQSY